MDKLHLRRYSNGDQSLLKRLAVIESLIFVLPFLIIFYLLYEKELFFQPSELTVITLIFILVLSGLIFLRQIFDRVLNIAAVLRKAELGENVPIDVKSGAPELETLSISLNRVMERMEKTTEKLDRKILELTTIRELYELARKSLDINALLNMVLEKAMSVTGSKIGSLVIVEEGARYARLALTKGLERDFRDNSHINIDDSFLKYVIAEKKAVVVTDIEQDSRTRKPNDPLYGSPSFMSMPVMIENRVAAIVNLANKNTGEAFSDADTQATSVMLDEIGFALENASLHGQLREKLREILQQNKKLEQEIAERRLMEEKLHRIRGELESMVEKRTAELVKVNEALSREIGERRQAEEVLRISEENYRLYFSNVSDIIYSISPDLTFMSVSPSSLNVIGYKPEELIGRSIKECNIFPADYQETAISDIMKILGGERKMSTVYEFLAKDGTKRIVEVSSAPLIRDESVIACISVVRDITERKKLELELLHSIKLESIGRLAGGVAHDFNNMLGVILGHVEFAIDKVDKDQSLLRDLTEIRNAAERSSNLTRQLLAFARKQAASPVVLDLNETIDGMLKMLRRLIGENNHLAWLPGANLWLIKIDPSQIDQILANLCVNASDAIAGVGKITVETGNVTLDEEYCAEHAGSAPGDYVLLVVSDDGCGMTKEVLSRLFEPFFTTKGMGKGTGLGLATIYGIVKQNNGFINVSSEPNQGATFKIYLPRHQGEAEQPGKEELREPAMVGHETVLLVEDEPALLDLSKLLLETQGYRVLAAGTPNEAIRLAEEYTEEIHLLMTDVVMPEMNGQDLAEKMLSLHPHLKCLFTSGYTANVIAHHGVLDEGVHFIQKPFSRKGLAAKVREVLDRK